MLFQPSYTTPNMEAIDATASNIFSCYLNAEGGTQINKYKLSVNDLDGNDIYTTGEVAISPVKYNEDTLSITVPNTSGMSNGYDYVWNIRLFEANPTVWITYGTVQSTSTTTNVYIRVHYNVTAGMYLKIGNETRQISTYSSSTGLAVVGTAFSTAPSVGRQYNVYANYVQSNDVFFKARALPVVAISNYIATVTDRLYEFTGTYTQSDNVDWKFFTFNLYDSSGILLDTSGVQNGGEIKYTFDGLLNGNIYQIELVMETQDGVSVTDGKYSFSVDYPEISIINKPLVTSIAEKNATNVAWTQPYVNAYTMTGTIYPYYEYISNSPYAGATSIYLYNNSVLKYNIETSLGSVVLDYDSTTCSYSTFPVGFRGDIIKLDNSNDFTYYKISYGDGVFTFNINNLYSGSITIHSPKSTWLLASSYTTYAEYVWDDTAVWDDSKYWFDQGEDEINDAWWKFVILPDNVLLTKIDGGISTSYNSVVTTNPSGSAPSGYNAIYIYGDQTCDYVWATEKILNSTEISETNGIIFKPEWTGATVLLANFDNYLDAGSIISLSETITDWAVYKKELGESQSHYITTVTSDVTSIIDYNVKNQTYYTYYVYPITATTVGGVMESDSTQTCWWNWSLTGLVESDTENIYYADTNNIWLFRLNLSSNSQTQNINKTLYEGFTKYPKISSGERNYLTGSINCLLGDVTNSVYMDSVQMKNDFSDFIKSGIYKLLKDPKGDIRLVDTTSNSFTILDASSQQPITVNFEWIEIGDTTDLSITEE